MPSKHVEKANILIEALPYIQRLAGKTIVIKYGGAAMTDKGLQQKFFEDVTLLKVVGTNPIIVHGGGPEINKTLTNMGVESKFHGGLRITDDMTMEVVQMVLTGKINKDIVAGINTKGGKAVGLCGIDANVIKVHKKPPVGGVDYGNVGVIDEINTELLDMVGKADFIPVIAPIGIDENGNSYNINADTVASEIATALQAEKLMFLTDIDGIYKDQDDPSSLIYQISVDEVYNLIHEGVISGGMLPKVQGCIKAVKHGVSRVHIINGTIPHPILLEIFTDSGIGTMVTN